MSKHSARRLRALLWACAFALCGLTGTWLVRANQSDMEMATHSPPGEPDTTGSLRSMRWCGAAWWCR